MTMLGGDGIVSPPTAAKFAGTALETIEQA
jgi:hypothetical protein